MGVGARPQECVHRHLIRGLEDDKRVEMLADDVACDALDTV